MEEEKTGIIEFNVFHDAQLLVSDLQEYLSAIRSFIRFIVYSAVYPSHDTISQ